jgi:hypothetical protein
MTTTDRRLLMLLIASLVLIVAVCLPVSAQRAAPQAAKTDADADDNEDEGGESPGEVKESVGDLFPGVQGISGKELARRIAELERKKAEELRRRPTTAAPSPAPSTAPSPAPSSAPSPAPASGAGTEKSRQPTAATAPAATPNKADAASIAGISDEAREFLAELERRTLRVAKLVEKAAEIRQDASTEARSLGSEERILYYLQYRGGFIREARAYYDTMKFPIFVYRYIYEQAGDALSYDKATRPADLPKEALTLADAHVSSLEAARRTCLLASAELFTQIRQLDAAEKLYALLTKRFPKDADIKKSYDAFVVIRDTPKPDGPPGIKPNRRYERFDENDPASPGGRYGAPTS